MSKIIGSTTTTPVPRSDWSQTDKTKADFIRHKPELGAISEKDEINKSDLTADIQLSLEQIDTKANIRPLSSIEYDTMSENEINANTLYILTDSDDENVSANTYILKYDETHSSDEENFDTYNKLREDYETNGKINGNVLISCANAYNETYMPAEIEIVSIDNWTFFSQESIFHYTYSINVASQSSQITYNRSNNSTSSGEVDVSSKMDKVTDGTSGNFIALDANGNAVDSGKHAESFVPIATYNSMISPHINDGNIHVTADEKSAWNAKLDESDLDSAIDTALAEAKESGEFDGVGIANMISVDSASSGGENKLSVFLTDGTRRDFTYYNGKDGIAPTLSSEEIDGGNRIKITSTSNGAMSTKTFDVMDGSKGESGSQIWTTNTAPHSPNYTFFVANLTGNTENNIKVGDLIFYSYYRYTVASIDGESVLTSNRQSLRGANGEDGIGIDSVERTDGDGSPGTTDTYTFVYSDGSTDTFTVYNGKNGTNGKDGTSVTVKSVSESTVDGGNNVVTFSDGKTVTIKNGSKGDSGKSAYEYAQDGGYIGTEAEFIANITREVPIITQGTGNSETAVMSQKAITDQIGKLSSELVEVKNQISGVTYTNLLPLAINADGTEFVGVNGTDGYDTGYRYSTSSGTLVADSAFCYTGFIPVKKGDIIRIKNFTKSQAGSGSVMFFQSDMVGSNRAGAIYESDFAERTIDGVLTLTPDNCSHLGKTIIAYFTLSTGIISDKTIITVNEEITTNTSDDNNDGGSSSVVSPEETPEVVIPSTLYGVVGHEFVLYYDNILKCMVPEDFVVSTVFANSSNSILNLKPQFDRMLKFTPTADHIGTHAITIKVMSRRTWETVATKESSIIISADTERIGRKVMFIGDSLTYASTYPAEIERMSNGGIVSVGTVSHSISFNDGTATILSEGRNSMASYDYVGRQTAHSYSNPFYNPDTEYSLTLDAKYTSATGYLTFDNSGSVSVLKHHFDFAYYMANNADTVGDLDAVFINLGTNGGNGYALSDVFVAFDAMIERIRAYSETLPIFLHLFPPTSRAGNSSRNSNGIRNVRIELDCRKGYYDCIQTLIDRYENDSRVTIVPTYTMLDTIYDYKRETVAVSARNDEKVTIGQTDSTHPAKAGYLHMADSYYNVLQYKLDNNDEPEVPEEPEEPEEPVSGYTNINSGEAGTVHASGVASLDKVVYQVGGYPSTSSQTGLNSDSKVTTFGMIPAVDGDTIYIKGINIYVGGTPTTQGTHARFAFYKSKGDAQNRTIIKAEHKFYNSSSTYVTLTCLDTSTNYYSIKINNTGLDYDYVGFSLETDAVGAAALIITKNEPIED